MQNRSFDEWQEYRSRFRRDRGSSSIFRFRMMFRTKILLNRFPRLHRQIMLRRHKNFPTFERIVGSDTDIVIEGFPRSGNSFSVRAFEKSQPSEAHVAHHLHSWSQLHYAACRGIPAIVLIRKPDEAVIAACAHAENKQSVPSCIPETLLLKSFFQYYREFYSPVTRRVDAFVIAPFEQVTSDFGFVVGEVNKKFGSKFVRFEHSSEAVDDIFRTNADHLSPSKQRNFLKHKFSGAIDDASLTCLRKECEVIYNRLVP